MLANCPFHTLARQQTELVCGLNQTFIDGLLRGLGNQTVAAVLAPTHGTCCVHLTASAATQVRTGTSFTGSTRRSAPNSTAGCRRR